MHEMPEKSNVPDTPAETETKPPFQYSIRTLMIITTVIAVFLAFGAPFILRVREDARRATCSSNIRQLALAMHNFESGNRKFPRQNLYAGNIPGNVTKLNVPSDTAAYDPNPEVNTAASYSFITQLLPHLEEGAMFKNIQFDKNPFVATNGKYSGTPIFILQCPSFTGKRETIGADYTAQTNADWKAPRKPMLTQYVAMGATTRENLFRDGSTPFTSDTLNGEPDGFIYSSKSPIRDGTIADGMAKTIMLAETREEKYATWIDGTTASLFGLTGGPTVVGTSLVNNNSTTLNKKGPYIAKANFGGTEDWEWGPSSMHPGMAHHAFGDGAVRAISDDIEATVYSAQITKASKVQYEFSDGEPIYFGCF